MARYSTPEQLWVEVDGATAIIGITDQGRRELGEVVSVELPVIGQIIASGAPICVLDSVKAALEIASPLSGVVIDANAALAHHPELVNLQPEGAGWLVRLKLTNSAELSDFEKQGE